MKDNQIEKIRREIKNEIKWIGLWQNKIDKAEENIQMLSDKLIQLENKGRAR